MRRKFLRSALLLTWAALCGCNTEPETAREQAPSHVESAPAALESFAPLRAKHSNKCLGVEGGSTAANTRLIQWSCNGALDQNFALRPTNDGYYNIVAQHSGQCVDVSGPSVNNGAQLIQWPCHGGDNQKFALLAMDDGSVSLVAKHSRKCVDIAGPSTADGAAAIQWDCHGGTNQRFSTSLFNAWACEAPPALPAGTQLGVVSGQIYRRYGGSGSPWWSLGQRSVINDIRSRLGAPWVRIEIRPTCQGTVHDNCEPAGTYESIIPAMQNCGLKVLAVVSLPQEGVQMPGASASDAQVDWWLSNYYLPRINEIVSRYNPDALEVINEPNVDNRFSPSGFALTVKRTYEYVRISMGRATPAIISGGILNIYDNPTGEHWIRDVANAQAFRDFAAVNNGRWPMDGFGIHPYQTHDWAQFGGRPNTYLPQALTTLRNIINRPSLPLWVTEFGWQNNCSCDATTLQNGYCGLITDMRACDSQVDTYMRESVNIFRTSGHNVSHAFWYDYRDDEPPSSVRHGLRTNQYDGVHRPKPSYSVFQSLTGAGGRTPMLP